MWGITGLLHDFDYERYPDVPDHVTKGSEILKERGYPDELITAIRGHVDYLECPRTTRMAKTLFAVDELSGFLTACALVQPTKRIDAVKVKSVKKKMKDKAFARTVHRESIIQGGEELEIELEDLVESVKEAMTGAAEALGLDGSMAQ